MARHKTFTNDYVPKWNIEIRARELQPEVYKHLAKIIGMSYTSLYYMRFSPLNDFQGNKCPVAYDTLYSTVEKVAKFFKCHPHQLLNVKRISINPVHDFNTVIPGIDKKIIPLQDDTIVTNSYKILMK